MDLPGPMADSHAQHKVWETIAASFDRNRKRRWPHVEAYLASLETGSSVLDLMAGNGRHIASILRAGHTATWLDWSRPAARIAAERYPDARVAVGEATHMPFRDGAFDAAILVAGLHSVPTAEGRAACLRELRRILRLNGSVQVTVWSREAPRFAREGEPGQPIDVVLPWRSHGHDEPRLYHLYTHAALRADLAAAGFEVMRMEDIEVVGPGPDNIVATARRFD